MSKEIKLEGQQWYRDRDDQIYWCVGRCAENRMDVFFVHDEHGSQYNYYPNGRYIDSEERRNDLIEHLPDCTGFDWKPPKPQPACRPFKNAEEFKPHRNKWVKYKQSDTGKTMLCVSFSNEGVTAAVSFMPYRHAFDSLVFEDGSPFGVEVTE